ncbi:MAG: hypothetical protein M3P50_05145, partial [Actinomycetota bacterium]|nr:hypothetical protein [Actinomycetota bacterium]
MKSVARGAGFDGSVASATLFRERMVVGSTLVEAGAGPPASFAVQSCSSPFSPPLALRNGETSAAAGSTNPLPLVVMSVSSTALPPVRSR